MVWGWGISKMGIDVGWGKSLLGRMIDEGPGASASTAPVLAIDSPPDVMIAAYIIDKLEDDVQHVLKQRYVKRASDRVGAHRLNCSRAEYRRRLHCGIWCVAGGLIVQKIACPDGPNQA